MSSKYLFFYLKTGGGHLSPARAVAKHLEKENAGKIEAILSDGLENGNKIVKYLIEDGYRISQNKATWIFESLYAINKIKFLAKQTARIVSWFVKNQLEKMILENNPEKIVIFHFFLIRPVFEILKKHKLNIPVITVVTDPYTAHPIWFLNKGQKYIVFSEQLKQSCIQKGMNASDFNVFPFVLDEKFGTVVSDENKKSIQQKLGLEPSKKLILILGGADGIPHGKRMLRTIMKSGFDAQTAIVCGRNKVLYEYATKLKLEHNLTNLTVYGFIDFVYELLQVSDVVISKCGASTFMEILMAQKIPVINNYIWEQEKGNVDFIRQNNMGMYEKKISRLPGLIHQLISDHTIIQQLNRNISRAGLSNGTPQVSSFIQSFC